MLPQIRQHFIGRKAKINMKRSTCYRVLFYITGLLVLALGLTLNTKTGLGVSPIISVAYSTSVIVNQNFGNATLALYSLFVIIELILRLIRERRYETASGGVLAHAGKTDRKLIFLMDILQIPLSLVFTRFLNLFSTWIPDLYSGSTGIAGEMVFRITVLIMIIAIILTGIGAAMSLNMRIVPNPGDGIVQAIADTVQKSVGFTKNCFDIFNISITVLISLAASGHLIGIGVGTILAMIGVGRTIAFFNHLTYDKMNQLAGIDD